MHDAINHTSMLDDYVEGCTEVSGFSYSTPNLRASAGISRRNVGSPTSMRGPGAVPGLFAIESAMDELAIKLKLDPVLLRLKNEPKIDEGLNIPFSSRHMVECLELGAKKFGWSKRNPLVGSMKDGDAILGWGMASCSWVAERVLASARVDFLNDGTARVSSATQDIGTGTYTALAQMVLELTGIPIHKVEVVLGDSALAPGPISGGSFATASLAAALALAIEKAKATLFLVAKSKFPESKPEHLCFSDGFVHLKNKEPQTGVRFEKILNDANIGAISREASARATLGEKNPPFSRHSFGAHFVEVAWRPQIARLYVSRVVTVIDGGHILNPTLAKNQIEGAVVMGIGMALFEETIYDPRFANPINNNFADYIVATNADVHEIDVTFLNHPDKVINPLGARGIGEIGLAGIAAAITAAVYHATGVRVRKLPVRLEDLL
jgi:xanthine dehydrogenase YagR molybdenum-binding subunit